MNDERFTSAALHTFALVATLRTALGVSQRIAARRAGEDPSEDEPEAPVRSYLGAAVGQMGSLLVRLRLRRQAILVAALREQIPPTASHLIIAPRGDQIRPVSQHHVQMVAHDGEAQHIDAELAGQERKPLLEPRLAVLVVLPGHRVAAAQKAPPHAAVDAVQDRDFTRIEQVASSQPCHGSSALTA